MPARPAPRWEDIRLAYVETPEPIKSLCKRFDITPADLAKQRKALGWPPRPSPIKAKAKPAAAAVPTEPPADAASDASPTATLKTESHAAMVERLTSLILHKIDEMQQRPTSNEPSSAADSEREARSIAVMIQGLARLCGLNNGADASANTPIDIEDHATDLDALRDNLAQRLARFGDTSRADRGPGEADDA
ncbi:MAG: hypothetical protein RL291_1778 [Pseudomonadota bacterium]|jgi:hypothetical protein